MRSWGHGGKEREGEREGERERERESGWKIARIDGRVISSLVRTHCVALNNNTL